MSDTDRYADAAAAALAGGSQKYRDRIAALRAGAKMLTAIAEATVPRISVIVRKAHGAGLYAFSGPGFRPDATLALPTAEIAVMGPEAAVNAVYFNAIGEIEDSTEREEFVAARRSEYAADVDLLRLASDLVIDAIVEPANVRNDLISRLVYASNKDRFFSDRRHGVPAV